MPCYDNLSGTLRQCTKLYDNVGGSLHEVNTGYDMVGGALRPYHSSEYELYNRGISQLGFGLVSGKKQGYSTGGGSRTYSDYGAWLKEDHIYMFPSNYGSGGNSSTAWMVPDAPAKICFNPFDFHYKYLNLQFEAERSVTGTYIYPSLTVGGDPIAPMTGTSDYYSWWQTYDGSSTKGTIQTHAMDDGYLGSKTKIPFSGKKQWQKQMNLLTYDLSKLQTKTWCLNIEGHRMREAMYSNIWRIYRIWCSEEAPAGIVWDTQCYVFNRNGENYYYDLPAGYYDNTF